MPKWMGRTAGIGCAGSNAGGRRRRSRIYLLRELPKDRTESIASWRQRLWDRGGRMSWVPTQCFARGRHAAAATSPLPHRPSPSFDEDEEDSLLAGGASEF